MTSDADTVALLERALEQTAAIIAAISASEARLATPCPGWDVAALVRHLTGQDLRNFLASARGEAGLAGAGRRTRPGLGSRFPGPRRPVDGGVAAGRPGPAAPDAGRREECVAQPRRSADRRAGHAWLGPGWPPASRPAWTRPWPSMRCVGHARCSGPSSAGQTGPSARRCRSGRMRRSTNGWQAGSAATPTGCHQATRPIDGLDPPLLARQVDGSPRTDTAARSLGRRAWVTSRTIRVSPRRAPVGQQGRSRSARLALDGPGTSAAIYLTYSSSTGGSAAIRSRRRCSNTSCADHSRKYPRCVHQCQCVSL